MKNGVVIKLVAGQYDVLEVSTQIIYQASASGKLRYVKLDEKSSFNVNRGLKTKKEQKRATISPKVGDYVQFQVIDGHPYIEEVLERKNSLTRPDVCNVDQVLLVFSAVNPEFSFHLLDQFLIIMEQNKLSPILVVSKIDRCDEHTLDELKLKLAYYEKMEYPVYYVNSKQRIGIDVLSHIFKHKITVLAGQTGVGKTTLLNALLPHLNLKTQEISKALGRGKHTTRHTELYPYNEGWIADTPGFSKIDIQMENETVLKQYYKDFMILSEGCKFGSSCNHISEPGCAVKAAIKGEVMEERYENYVSFYTMLKQQKKIY